MWPFSRKSPEEKFWDWFVKNERTLFDTEAPNGLFTHLAGELNRYKKGLTWEVSPRPDQQGKRQFVISADGIRDRFSAVEALADAAPRLNHWSVVRFRPRRWDYGIFEITMDGVRVLSEDIEASLSPNGGKVDVALHIRGCKEPREQAFMGIGFLLIDSALGEYDVECKVAGFDVVPFDFNFKSGGQRVPWPQFRAAFDACFEQMHPG